MYGLGECAYLLDSVMIFMICKPLKEHIGVLSKKAQHGLLIKEKISLYFEGTVSCKYCFPKQLGTSWEQVKKSLKESHGIQHEQTILPIRFVLIDHCVKSFNCNFNTFFVLF